jgi:monoterpene epsilon-lactone hydrolase
MPSQESQVLTDLYLKLNSYLRSETLDTDLYRIIMEEIATVGAEPSEVTYEQVQCPGTVRPAIWFKPQSAASSSSVILYLHGGAFIAGSPSSHRKLVGHLAKKAGCQALSLDYRRAPDYQFPSQIEDALAAYKWLLNEKGYSSKNIAFAGDSAGGNLVVSTSLAAKQAGLDVPAAIAAFSPWIDMKLSGKTYQTNTHKDVVVIMEAIQGVVNTYVGKASLDDSLIDLIHTDLKGLPPMYLTAGTAEVLQDDAVMLAENARKAGVDVQLELTEDMQHVWVCMAGNAPEADKTLSQAADFIRKRIGK